MSVLYVNTMLMREQSSLKIVTDLNRKINKMRLALMSPASLNSSSHDDSVDVLALRETNHFTFGNDISPSIN